MSRLWSSAQFFEIFVKKYIRGIITRFPRKQIGRNHEIVKIDKLFRGVVKLEVGV